MKMLGLDFATSFGTPWSESGVRAVRKIAKSLAEATDAHLVERTQLLRGAPETVPAIALAAEMIRRVHGLTAHDVQLRAGLALAEGRLVEMATGEGKTLVALLPAFCFALRGRGAHVATVNSYLAERDAEFARAVFSRLGMTVGYLKERAQAVEKQKEYACDVTYGVGTEFGFDYLRDQLAIRNAGRQQPLYHELYLRRLPPKPLLAQRGQAFAVIDEADSVLLDEARSPLIIATGQPQPSLTPEVYLLANDIAAGMVKDRDYTHDTHYSRYSLTEAGEQMASQRLSDELFPQLRRLWRQYIEQALHVQDNLRKDVHYVLDNGKVVIVDEFTGRLCPDRSWRDGLHQAVEAHAGVGITEENGSEATISRPAYFQLYERVCGLSGTIAEAAPEMRGSYKLPTTVVPPHKKCRREVLPDRVFTTREAKHRAVAEEVLARHRRGQPVLIGTRTIENSEALVAALAPLGLRLKVLNAKEHKQEAEIIHDAGEPGAITIATNMAGRGAHIPVPPESVAAGGLHVIGLEKHESKRIDRQLIGRAARQGQPGSAQFFLCLEDFLIVRHAEKAAKDLAERGDAQGELHGNVAALFDRLQRMVEERDEAMRKSLAAHHKWLDELKKSL